MATHVISYDEVVKVYPHHIVLASCTRAGKQLLHAISRPGVNSFPYQVRQAGLDVMPFDDLNTAVAHYNSIG